MTSCETTREFIDSWLDGELSPPESDSVRAHVAVCVPCGELCRQLEKLQGALKVELAAEATALEFMPFWRGVQQRINQRRTWHDELLDRCRALFPATRIAWSVPAAIVLVLAFYSLRTYLPGWGFGDARDNFAAVESIDTFGHSVALLRENETRTTVIWLYQDQEGENEAAEDTTESGPTF